MGRGKGTIARVNSTVALCYNLQSTTKTTTPVERLRRSTGTRSLKENVPENQAFTRVWASKASFVASRSDQDREKRRFGERI